jgi:prepilin-type N-terminal cleavage/methylation domain-containing protein
MKEWILITRANLEDCIKDQALFKEVRDCPDFLITTRIDFHVSLNTHECSYHSHCILIPHIESPTGLFHGRFPLIINMDSHFEGGRLMRKQTSTQGFTLIELVVVIGIIAILAAVSIVAYTQVIRQARESRVNTELEVIIRQIELAYYADPYQGDDGSSFTVSYEVAAQRFAITDGTGDLTLSNAETRLAEAINQAITETSSNPSTIAQPWTSANPLVDASTSTIEQAFQVLGLPDQEGVLFINLIAGSITMVYYTNQASGVWENVTLRTP